MPVKTGAATRLAHAAVAVYRASLTRAFFALSLASLAPLASFAVDGTETVTGGGTIAYTNAESATWVEGDLLLKFTYDSTSATPGSFTLPGVSQVRILAIGGGGGGGGAYYKDDSSTGGCTGYYGGGGGGGAGGFVEESGYYSAALFNVVVGKGGAGGAVGATHKAGQYNGESGYPTTISTNGATYITALGGGGGANEAVGVGGQDLVGSGGGGSMYRQTASAHPARAGGVGTDGQGHAGGRGDLGTYGGGGGGAGGPGGDASTTNPTGGVGRVSNITGPYKWYAGVGGGGHSDKDIAGETVRIAGGLGGGGGGGVGTDLPPKAGDPCTGGGGGGAHANTSSDEGGAAGGSGVVYVRISLAIEGDLNPPDAYVEKTYNGQAQQSVAESFAYTITGTYIATNAGTYVATVTLKDGFDWSNPATPRSYDITMKINKAQVEFLELWQKSWMFGTPDEATPAPRCRLNFAEAVPTFTYGPDGGPYVPEKPTAVDNYVLHAEVLESQNLLGAVSNVNFSIINGLGGQFTDYVEITIDPYLGTDPSVLTNFPYKVTLSEDSPYGFLYSRAGKTGDDMAFTDMDGTPLFYAVDEWNLTGESTVYVRIPRIDSTPKTILLYWHLREGQSAPPHDPSKVWADWSPAEAAAVASPDHAFDLVVRDGYKVEYWAVKPKMTLTMWDASDAVKGELNPVGTTADGAEVKRTIIDAHSGAALAALPQTDIGSYRIIFELADPGEYEPFLYTIDFCITGDITFDDLKRGASTLTLSGRVMLANDDTAAGYEVTDQSYWQTADVTTNDMFWTHEGLHYASGAYLPNVRKFDGYNHELCQYSGGSKTNVIWRFYNVLFGNTYKGDDTDATSTKNFLPCSPTQQPTYSKTGVVGSKTEAGNILLRNMVGAVVYSPCYTNGIGTIYFDAVNGWTGNIGAYCIVVELATETIDGKAPTDENSYGDNGWGNDTWDGRLRESVWKPCQMTPLKRDGTPNFTLCDKTYTNSLDISNSGTSSNFYRICVGVDCRKPCRFRIRRVTFDSELSEDDYALLLLDNIVVSYPRATVKAEPYGWYDYAKAGKAALGQEAAMAVPFPKIGEAGVRGRAKVSGDVSAITNADASTFVLLSRMHYRWRYLGQQVGEWQFVDLPPATDFVSSEFLSLPSAAGDIEFFFESFTDLPSYEYHDYSGSGLGLGGLYTESQKMVTNTWQNTGADAPTAEKLAPSGGTDWFFRMREGSSSWEKLSVVVNGLATDMELVGENLWRGLVDVSDLGASGELPFYFELSNRQTPGDANFAVNADQWYPQLSVTNVPGRGAAASTYAGGNKVLVDDVSGYLEFQLNDRSGVFSVGHAEYQTFNGWHDAHADKFVGSSVLTSGVNSVEMMQTNVNTRTWKLPTFSSTDWDLPFTLTDYTDSEFPKDKFFISHLMPGNFTWTGELGQFVDANHTKSNHLAVVQDSGIAWQMRGKSLGKVTRDISEGPSGLDTVTFKARLGQSVDFGDFSICQSDGTRTKSNYTFVFPAVMSIANGNDCSPDASMSLVGYYRANKGCYEFRVERCFGTDGLQLSLYKWVVSGGEMTCQCIASQWYSGATFQHSNTTKNTDYSEEVSGTKIPYVFGMFLSLGEDGGNTTIIAGLGSAKQAASASFSDTTYRWICCIDNTDTKLTSGSYGALSTNCKGIFLTPRVWSNRVPLDSKITANTTSSQIQSSYPLFKYYANPSKAIPKVVFAGTSTDIGDTLADDEWDLMLGRAELDEYKFTSTGGKRYGIRSPNGLTQTVDLYLKPRGGTADWKFYDSREVSSYGWVERSITVRTNANVNVQLRAGSKSTDVAVWQIKQTGWNGEDIQNAERLDKDFIYTQATIIEKIVDGIGSTKVTNKYARLQPARAAAATRPLSLRGPMVNGVGMIGFSYENVDPACEILVQVATNNVTDHLYGSGNYNESLLEVPLGEQEPPGYWITVTNYTAAALAGASSKEFYFGWHDTSDNPLVGVMRILVKPTVVHASHAVAKTKPEYGAITITDMWVHDEPPLDNKSWIGWNLRTIGGKDDEERRMYLPDMIPGKAYGEVGVGLSAGLNNSTTADIAGDPTEYSSMNPTIQSPTFGGSSCIGQVRFRARVYTNEVESCKVFLYGALDGAASSWTQITNFTVSATTYKSYSFSAIGDRYKAIRLAVDGVVSASAENPTPQRVLIDEVVVSEKAEASIAFAYARPFRNYLNDDVVVPDILDRAEQPLVDESWGVQAKLRVGDFDTDIDVERGFKVTFRYFVGDSPWGFANWESAPGASKEVELRQVGDASEYVFRSTVARPSTIVPAQRKDGTVVQYMLTAKFYLKGSDVQQSENIALSKTDGWSNPEWYEPVDLNEEHGGVFSPYTILETVAPGRAWINEVNYNDGPRAQNGGSPSLTNQFIEIAIPRGVDMTGWRVDITDMNHRSLTIARLGRNGRPAKKTAFGVPSGDYDLYVLQSPATHDAGGLRDALTGQVVADATWVDATLQSTFKAGTLQYDEPYQFELVRPSGIVEHQIVVGGTNEWRGTEYEYYATGFDATNLMAELDVEFPSTKRLYAGDDCARKADGATFSSLGVSGAAHGEDGGWSAAMRFTPGRVNDGQDELSGWAVRPNGNSCWVYASVFGDGISQRIGTDSSSDMFVVVTSGSTTNIEYTLAQWYQMGVLTVNGETNAAAAGAKNSYVLTLSNVTGTTYVVAHDAISSDLTDAGLDLDDPYTPAVIRWLSAGVTLDADGNPMPFANPTGPISLAKYLGFSAGDVPVDIPLKEMYWYDIDPTEGGWWMRGGTVDFLGSAVYRKRRWNDYSTSYYTNRQMRVKIYFSNDVSKVVHVPYRLQGLGGERSDDPSFTSTWTSETFKVMVELKNDLPANKGYMPFRWFVFGSNSFEPKGSANGEYTALIEILDPFSQSSPGNSYGWHNFADCPLWFKWKIDETREAMGVEMLNKDSSYKNPPYEDWTP